MSTFYWVIVCVATVFTVVDLRERDYIGAFLALGLIATGLVGALN
jgi:hypothetical protein